MAKKCTFQIQVMSGRAMWALTGGAQIFDLPLQNLTSEIWAASQCHAALGTPEIKNPQDFSLRNYTEYVATVTLTDAHINLINTRWHLKPDGRYSKSEGKAK